MFGLSGINRPHRLMLGIIALLIVDVLSVVSGEITKFIFHEANFNKPFFTTYIKTAMFSVYLLGFLVWKPWRDQCCFKKLSLGLDEVIPAPSPVEPDSMLGSPIYVPLKYDNYDSHTSGGESDDASSGGTSKSVRFSNLSEVRQLSETFAIEHNLARLSYHASIQAAEKLNILKNRLPLIQVVKLSCYFSVFWFFANYTYQLSVEQSDEGFVGVLFSTSGLFVLIASSVFPASSADKFTLSKLVAVFISISGIIMVFASGGTADGEIPTGAIWALFSAISFTVYLVLFRRKVEKEDKIDIPMFLGFVGIISAISMWPGFLILHYSKQEPFEWPSRKQWLYILVNGAIGTVLSEFLWLLGCFLTSSLISTLSLSLLLPMNMLATGALKDLHMSVLFYLGSLPVVLGLIVVSLLTYWENWDPVMLVVKKVLLFFCRRRGTIRVRELDREQTASLITEESHH